MHILYIDESGVEELNAGTPHFVLLGVTIPALDWKPLDAALDAVKSKYQLSGCEIHTAWMARRYSEQESIPGFEALGPAERIRQVQTAIKKRAGVLGVQGNPQKLKGYRRESQAIAPYLHLTRQERRDCLSNLASVLRGWNSLRVFAEAVSKPDFLPGLRDGPYELAFEQVLTRFHIFLQYADSSGIVVHDNNTKVAPRLHGLSRKFHQDGTLYRQIPRIVETPLFVDSAFTGMIQMADLCSYALRRLLENGETWLWDIVEPCVDSYNGRKVGVRHYTGKRPCNCRICLAHGRKP